MKSFLAAALLVAVVSCSGERAKTEGRFSSDDKEIIHQMVKARESAMINRDIDVVVQQFDTAATFINGGGYYYEGIDEIRRFHEGMFHNDSLVYTYKAGEVLVNPVQSDVALVYYPWQQNWTMKNVSSDTFPEIGLMTIIAIKKEGRWRWKSITNQRTKEYFPNLSEHKAP
jgi:ketosteroid isomerase-like protein